MASPKKTTSKKPVLKGEPVVILTTVLTVLAVVAGVIQGIIENLSGGQTLTQAIINVIAGGTLMAAIRPLVSPVKK